MDHKRGMFRICLISESNLSGILSSLLHDGSIKLNQVALATFSTAIAEQNDIFLIHESDLKKLRIDSIQSLITGRGRKKTALVATNLKPNDVIRCVRAGFAEVFDRESESDLVKEWVLERYEESLRSVSESIRPVQFDPTRRIIGESPEIDVVRQLCTRASGISAMTVLIQGGTGTGKELVARVIHDLSARARGPFVEVNSSAIPDNLMESEMFGYEKGAFTDAKRQKKGLFELAHGGTLFLDEIGVMSLQLQNKILKAVEEKKIRRIGGDSEIEIDVKIIAGTNVNLRDAAEHGRFRPDLYYRLNVFTIDIPDLSRRPSDVKSLSLYFLKDINKRYGLDVTGFHPSVLDLFEQYPWPGNVRELKHAVERCAVMAGKGRILPSHLPDNMQKLEMVQSIPNPESLEDKDLLRIPLPPGGIALNDLETYIIREVLKRFNNNQSRAAAYLRIARTRLIRNLPHKGVQG